MATPALHFFQEPIILLRLSHPRPSNVDVPTAECNSIVGLDIWQNPIQIRLGQPSNDAVTLPLGSITCIVQTDYNLKFTSHPGPTVTIFSCTS